MPSIPRILHQTWKNRDLPARWQRNAETWRHKHPDWEYRLWTDEMNRDLVASCYPELLAVFDAYSYPIERADAARYCMLHQFGGVYADLDIECLQPLEPLLEAERCLLVQEPAANARNSGMTRLVSNAFMAAEPGHPVFRHLIDWLISHPGTSLVHGDILASTGPIMVTRALDAYRGEAYSLLRGNIAFPFPPRSIEISMLREREDGYQEVLLDALAMGAYAVHHWDNTWVGNLAGDFFNPEPHHVPGFRFVPGLDSRGNDVANVGRDVPAAARACLALGGVVAFNTDGFAKSALLPRDQWQPLGDGTRPEGLYIRTRGITHRLKGLLQR